MRVPKFVLKAAQYAAGVDADGLWGPKTLAALRQYDMEHDEIKIAMGDKDKLIVSVAQHAAGMPKRKIDGIYGPATEKAVKDYVAEQGLDEDKAGARARARAKTQSGSGARSRATAVSKGKARTASGWATWQPHEGPDIYEIDDIDLRDGTIITPKRGMDEIPTRRIMKQVYGDALALGESGIKKRLVSLRDLPGRFNKGEGKLYGVHKLAAPHLRLALQLCEQFGVIDEIYRIGTFNYRHMRHDKSRPLSYHSYGIALDMNPRENFAWSPKPNQRKVNPFTKAWQKKYPRGLSEVVVLCFKKVGYAWGGDWPSFRDPMHFELVARRR
ncbi:MAG: M15 family metallopeptidase [Proteobacteria bacterium]|nr:M15 family metallopeptidase [Pseudomonadota bacterium]